MKNLTDMSLEELWQLFPIILREHNPAYAEWYHEEEERILCLLDDALLCRISHIGSTAVEGLIAKPTVDILLELPEGFDLDTIACALQQDGWLIMQRSEAEHTLDLNKGYTPDGFAEKVFHLHVKPSGDWDELYFRDYLRSKPEVARAYEALKTSLQKQFEHNRDAYTEAKTAFIQEHSLLARREFGERYRPE